MYIYIYIHIYIYIYIYEYLYIYIYVYISADASLAGGNVYSIPIYNFPINQVTKLPGNLVYY